MKVLLIAGGWSSERDISLLGAAGMLEALQSLGHETHLLDPLTQFDEIYQAGKRHDVALLNLHGRPGEDGLVQAILDAAGCPYQGAGPAGSLLALHKSASKQILREAGLPTPDWEFLPFPPGHDWRPKLDLPLFVKSDTGGSSLRLGRACTRAELESLLKDIFAVGESALLETEVIGKELTCGVLGNEPLPPILIEPMESDFFDYNSKYAKNGAKEICPAPLPEQINEQVQKLALAAHHALGLKDLSRTDFILDAQGNLHILEVNTLPGMTPTSLVPQEAMAIGLDFPCFLEKLISLACQKKSRGH